MPVDSFETAATESPVAAPPSAAYGSSAEHMRDHAVRVGLHLKHFLLRHWRRLTDASGRLSDLEVSVHEVLDTLGAGDLVVPSLGDEAPTRPTEALARIEADLAAWEHHIAHRVASTPPGTSLTLEDLRADFRLDEAALDVLVTLATLQSDLPLARLCTFAWADFTRKQPDVSFLVDLLALGPRTRASLQAAFGVNAALVRHRLVTLHDSRDWQPETPRLFKVVALPDRVADFLHEGRAHLEKSPQPCARFAAASPSLERLYLDPVARDRAVAAYRAARRKSGDSGHLIVLHGPSGIGRLALANAIVAAEGRRTLVCDARALVEGDGVERLRLFDAVRDAHLLGAVVMLDWHGVSSRPDDNTTIGMAARALRDLLRAAHGPVFMRAAGPIGTLASGLRCDEIAVPFTSPDLQTKAWSDALERDGGGAQRFAVDELAGRFNLGAGRIQRAVAEAVRAGRREKKGEPIAETDIHAAARRQMTHRLGALATPQYTTMTWDDLILPEAVGAQLQEIQKMMRHQQHVYSDWGFRKLAGGRRGLAVLFAGPPGTGKTASACILGRALGREVYRVDLSQVVDKYIGETEKRLAQLFDEAEYAPMLLLFDEADSLFTKRTEVQSSHDRYANLEVNFLLQRIEAFEGICILTTNNESSIDPAFMRRLRFRVRFPEPDANDRRRLWQALMPSLADVADDVRWDELAREFRFAGGHIRNALLRAAFAAAEDGGGITHAHIRRAAVAEARELGHVVRGQ